LRKNKVGIERIDFPEDSNNSKTELYPKKDSSDEEPEDHERIAMSKFK
jgi:hypothetical protein